MKTQLSISDVRTVPAQKVLDYLEECFFHDSTVTMSNEEYIKKSVIERLSQVVMFSEGVISLNRDPESLSKAMLRSSLSEEDINFILSASLKVSDVSIVIKDAADTDGKTEDKDTAEGVNKMIKHKMETMGSLENLICLIEDCYGTSRIVPFSSREALMEAKNQNIKLENARKDMVRIERPVDFNLDFLDMSKIPNSEIFNFLNSLMASDSNSSMEIQFPIDALTDDLKLFFTVDLPMVAEAAVEYAKNSIKNSLVFTQAPDAFESLFNTL